MSDQIRIAIDQDVIESVKKDANSALHQDVPYGRAVAWLHGEYKRLRKLEKVVAQDLTRVSLTDKAVAEAT